MDSISLLNGIDSEYINKVLTDGTKASGGVDKSQSFSGLLDAAKELVGSTNTYVKQAEQAEMDYALGLITSTHELGVIQQKASLSLQYTVAIRDKLVDAYKEIMAIQI